MRTFIFILGLFFSIAAWISDNITVVNENTYNILFFIAIVAVFLSILAWWYLSIKKGWLWIFSFMFVFNGVGVILDVCARFFHSLL
ncbi:MULTISPECIES: hypothetical protein [Buttiauxella]|uniref:hypothetical protein n=1 Tax=Buttiauxella TaxID=82976 RepID=UPI0007E3D862|nr:MULTISPECIES: hypothetical protein [Buttiauxella]